MAVYTDITDAELEAFLAEFDLGQALAFKGIAEGVSNSNFMLETTAGRFILTIYEKRAREEDLPYFLDLMRWLARAGFPSPTPTPDRDGEVLKRLCGKPAALVSYLAGVSVKRPKAAHCREAGAGLAALHKAAEGFPGHRRNDLGHEDWARMFAADRDVADRLRPGLAATIDGDLALLAGSWPTGLPQGVIHADFFPDNVFFLDGRFAAAIDFYFACNDAFAYDLGVCLNAWCFESDGSFNHTNARALLAGYESGRPLSAAERAALPVLAHGAAMRFFLTRLHDWEATPAGALVKPHNPLDYEARLAFHRAANGRLDLFES
ncbi:MAG: homoserine kinase [Caulobacterales bacterium 32-69-10]|nr:MAG: homoserine kinase [Caulobacterales bacterium 32-69-10]